MQMSNKMNIDKEFKEGGREGRQLHRRQDILSLKKDIYSVSKKWPPLPFKMELKRHASPKGIRFKSNLKKKSSNRHSFRIRPISRATPIFPSKFLNFSNTLIFSKETYNCDKNDQGISNEEQWWRRKESCGSKLFSMNIELHLNWKSNELCA